MLQPFFSVIIPTFNRATLLEKAINSVLAQSFTDFELIVVNDGSTDNTKEVMDAFTDSRIRYIYQHNQEKCVARNTGIENANGRYICFLDNDDYFLPGHLQGFYNLIIEQKEPVAMIVSGLYIEDASGRVKHEMFIPEKSTPLRFVWNNFIVPSSTCLHKDILKEFRFSEKYSIWEDRHLWLRVLTRYPMYQVPEYSVTLLDHKGRATTNFYKKISIESLKNYFDCIDDLFLTHGHLLSSEISESDRRRFIAYKSLGYFHITVKNAQFKESFFLLKKLLAHRPGFVFSQDFYKLMLLLPYNRWKRKRQAVDFSA